MPTYSNIRGWITRICYEFLFEEERKASGEVDWGNLSLNSLYLYLVHSSIIDDLQVPIIYASFFYLPTSHLISHLSSALYRVRLILLQVYPVYVTAFVSPLSSFGDSSIKCHLTHKAVCNWRAPTDVCAYIAQVTLPHHPFEREDTMANQPSISA